MLHSSIYSTSHVAMSIIVAYPQVVTRHSFTRREKKTARSCRGAANIYPTNARFRPQTPRNETKRSGSQIKSLELNIVPHPQPNTARSKKKNIHSPSRHIFDERMSDVGDFVHIMVFRLRRLRSPPRTLRRLDRLFGLS